MGLPERVGRGLAELVLPERPPVLLPDTRCTPGSGKGVRFRNSASSGPKDAQFFPTSSPAGVPSEFMATDVGPTLL